MDESSACHTEWSKSEREKQVSYINTYTWNLERRYQWTYLQGSHGDVDLENRPVDTVGEGPGGTNGASGMETYVTVREIDS